MRQTYDRKTHKIVRRAAIRLKEADRMTCLRPDDSTIRTAPRDKKALHRIAR